MRQRRETVEHPFGTIKARMGATHFLMKRLPNVATEMSLHVLAHNFTRAQHPGLGPADGGNAGLRAPLLDDPGRREPHKRPPRPATAQFGCADAPMGKTGEQA
jgi:transposase